MTSPTWAERPDPCAECGRLREQARAAVLTHDRSQLADVRVMQTRHRTAAHGQAEQVAERSRAS